MRFVSFCLLLVSAFMINSEGCGSRPVGSDDVLEITHVEFSVDSTYATSTKFIIKGTVKNTGSSSIQPPWYIEASFYKDNTYSHIFGGSSTMKNFALDAGVTTDWSLSYSSGSVVESEYPNFGVKDLRVYVND